MWKRAWRLCLTMMIALVVSAHVCSAQGNAVRRKPVITGFIDMQTISWHNTDDSTPDFTMSNVEQFPGMFGGIALNATWWQMQPRQGGPIKTTLIDNALAQVHQYNLAHPTAQLGVKLRIFSGNQAPPWAKALAGGPLAIQRNPQGCKSGNCPITIGVVWSAPYIAAWRAFQRKVAARYDTLPLIRSVAITSCTMQTDEPFVMPVDQPIPTGYTDAEGEACLMGAVKDYAAWHRTPIDYTINAFDKIQQGESDPAFSDSIMTACRATLGFRCELGNHAFYSTMPAGNAKIVATIASMGGPIHYQTIGTDSVPTFEWEAMVRAARADDASAVELWPDKKFNGFTTLSQTRMKNLVAIFNGDAP